MSFGFRGGAIEAPAADPLPLTERVAAKILARQAAAAPARPFVTWDRTVISYGEADRRANQAANALARQGVGTGTRVALFLKNCPEYLDLWFALSRLGAIQIPINTEFRALQIRHVLQRAPVPVIVAEADLLPELADALGEPPHAVTVLVIASGRNAGLPRDSGGLSWLDYRAAIERAPDESPATATSVSGTDIAAVMNTSGTTGPSKGVLLTHAQQYILGRMIAADMDLRADDIYYNFFPLFHNTAQAMITIPVLLKGAHMVLTEKFSASRFWEDVHRHRCTAFYYIGEVLRILLKTTQPGDAAGAGLRVAWGIGASPDDFEAFQQRHGAQMRTGYGSTEANVPVYLPHSSAPRGSCGRVVPGFQLRIANALGQALPPGEVGEILVRADEPCAIMHGYDHDSAATAAAWQDLWLHTGDAGRVDSDGNLFFTGRVKDAIRVRGENISAFEVEQVIGQLDGVAEVAAIAVPCPLGGDDLKVVIVRSDGSRLSPEQVIAHARRLLPKFSVPKYVEFVAALPKTPTNKVQKHLLRSTPFSPNTWDRDAIDAPASRPST